MFASKRCLLPTILFMALFLTFVIPAHSQKVERIINKILNGQKVKATVTVDGVVDKWDINPANNTIAYILRDDWGDNITVIATGQHPETQRRYHVSGYVSYDQANREYVIMETGRKIFGAKEHRGPNWIIIALALAIAIVLVVLVFVLYKSRSVTATQDFGSDAVVTVSDKTVKLSAAVASEQAIIDGTVKVMPGRFEVTGGSELKEIRLIRPKGVPDNRLYFTFGRLPGDRITHIQLEHNTVSKDQARLNFQNNIYNLMNIPDDSSNPTVINNQKLSANESRELHDGDIIQMGLVTLTYRK